jgi:hypothetical protein
MKNKLLKLMQQYPDAEIIPMVDWESNDGEYSTSTSEITNVNYSEYVMIDNFIYDDKESAIDRLWDDKYHSDILFKDMDRKKQDKYLEDEYNKLQLEKAIFIYIG